MALIGNIQPRSNARATAPRRHFYIWILPVLWMPFGFLGALRPGDLNLTFFLATIPGAWVTELLPLQGVASKCAQISGAVVFLVGVGAILDRLGASARLMYGLIVAISVGVAILAFDSAEIGLILCSWAVFAFAAIVVVWITLQKLVFCGILWWRRYQDGEM